MDEAKLSTKLKLDALAPHDASEEPNADEVVQNLQNYLRAVSDYSMPRRSCANPRRARLIGGRKMLVVGGVAASRPNGRTKGLVIEALSGTTIGKSFMSRGRRCA